MAEANSKFGKYGILIDADDVGSDETGRCWGFEHWPADNLSVEKPMDEIIITLANNHSARVGGYHYTWMAPEPREDPRRATDE